MNMPRKITLGIILSLIISILLVLLSSTMRIQVLSYRVEVEVGDFTSLSITPDLKFGKLKPGERATKTLVLKNNFVLPVKARLFAKGVLSSWLRFKKYITIPPLSTVRVEITIIVPSNANKMIYEGEIVVEARRCLLDP